MLNKNAQAWVDALRSGKYKQGRNSLHIIESGDSRFCCLGVACDLFSKTHPEVSRWEPVSNGLNNCGVHRFVVNTERSNALLPPQVCEWLGLTQIVKGDTLQYTIDNANVTYLQDPLTKNLVLLNDEGLCTFDEIADVIEAYQKELFNA